MPAKYDLSKWFARGAGHVVRYRNSDLLAFTWNGRAAGTARYVAHVKRYSRAGIEHSSLAALLRAVEAEMCAQDEKDMREIEEALRNVNAA